MATEIIVFSPRYHDDVALIKKDKVGKNNIIIFPKARSMPLKYYLALEVARFCPVEKHTSKAGKVNEFYAVPCDVLRSAPYEGRTR
jgi:hypothetical protein